MNSLGNGEGRERSRSLESANDSSTTALATKKIMRDTETSVSIHRAAANLSSRLTKLRSEADKEMLANLLSTIPKTLAQQDAFVEKQARREATIDRLNSLARSRDLAQSNLEKEIEREEGEQREQDLKEIINVLASKLVCAEEALKNSNQNHADALEEAVKERYELNETITVLKNEVGAKKYQKGVPEVQTMTLTNNKLANATKEVENLEPISNENAPEVEVLPGEKERSTDTNNANDSSPGEDLSTGNAPGDGEHESHESSSPLHSCRL
jgi:hypothetical protein